MTESPRTTKDTRPIDAPALAEHIESSIYLIRGQKVMLDRDLAKLYDVETKRLIEAVKRNIERFPPHFMFQLSKEELANWKSQIATSNSAATMGLRKRPYAFTEQGVAMLSSVLRSERAVQVNIAIIDTFVRLRQILLDDKDLSQRLARLERRYDAKFKVVFDAIRELMTPGKPPRRRRIGFRSDDEERDLHPNSRPVRKSGGGSSAGPRADSRGDCEGGT